MLIEDEATVCRRSRSTAARRSLLDQVGVVGLGGVGGARFARLTMVRRPDRCRPGGRDSRNVFA